jgi:DNA-binding protein HU-beta
MSKMTKSQLMTELSAKSGHTKKEIIAIMDLFVKTAYAQVKKSGEFVVPGLGKLVKVKRAARMARNPATGAEIKVPAKTVVRFRVAKAAKEALL